MPKVTETDAVAANKTRSYIVFVDLQTAFGRTDIEISETQPPQSRRILRLGDLRGRNAQQLNGGVGSKCVTPYQLAPGLVTAQLVRTDTGQPIWSDNAQILSLDPLHEATAFGYETPTSAMPTTGTATFTGLASANVFKPVSGTIPKRTFSSERWWGYELLGRPKAPWPPLRMSIRYSCNGLTDP